MKLLLDESVPRKLGDSFPETFEIHTVPGMGWAGTENGELLRRAAHSGFGALITADSNIEHQQNPKALPIAVVVLRAPKNRLQELQPLVPAAVAALRDRSLGKAVVNVGVHGDEPKANAPSP